MRRMIKACRAYAFATLSVLVSLHVRVQLIASPNVFLPISLPLFRCLMFTGPVAKLTGIGSHKYCLVGATAPQQLAVLSHRLSTPDPSHTLRFKGGLSLALSKLSSLLSGTLEDSVSHGSRRSTLKWLRTKRFLIESILSPSL